MTMNYVTAANRLVRHVPQIWLDDVSTLHHIVCMIQKTTRKF